MNQRRTLLFCKEIMNRQISKSYNGLGLGPTEVLNSGLLFVMLLFLILNSYKFYDKKKKRIEYMSLPYFIYNHGHGGAI